MARAVKGRETESQAFWKRCMMSKANWNEAQHFETDKGSGYCGVGLDRVTSSHTRSSIDIHRALTAPVVFV